MASSKPAPELTRQPTFRHLELGGGRVSTGGGADDFALSIPAVESGYTDAQIDNYGGRPRRGYPHRPGTTLTLRARASAGIDELRGTAGFGFWNAPFGDPTVRRPALPQAAWYFFGSAPGTLPLAPVDHEAGGRGWFAATIDAGAPQAVVTAPLAPVVVLLNQFAPLRRRVWPWVQRRLAITYHQLAVDLSDWHTYRLVWSAAECLFTVDGTVVLQAPFSPRGPLGFVCWIDNQYLVLTPRARFAWGTLPLARPQTLFIEGLSLRKKG